ncbi:MAG: hypothetical protein AB3N16_02475 [Flavobacteriaceae bacterium]
MIHKALLTILILSIPFCVYPQLDANLLLGLHAGTTAEINAISSPITGSLVYNSTTDQIWYFNGTSWTNAGASTVGWNTTGNAGLNDANDFLGTTDSQDVIFKANNDERLRLLENKKTILVNGALEFNNHPLIIRANGNDVLAFQDNAGTTKWHWNILGNGLNFVETGVADYRLFLKNGGNVGFNTSNPQYTADINGTARIGTTPTITTATKALVKNPTTGQISEQAIMGKYVQNFHGRAYFYNNRWYSPSDAYGVSYQHWNQYKGNGTNPNYNTNGQAGMAITSDATLLKFTIKTDFNANPTGTQQINLSVLRGGSYTTIGTYTITGGSTSISVQSIDVNFDVQENDLLVWACKTISGANRLSYTSLTFEFTY